MSEMGQSSAAEGKRRKHFNKWGVMELRNEGENWPLAFAFRRL